VRRTLVAVHVAALALWLGSLVFSFLLAKTLLDAIRPVCPACLGKTEGTSLLACVTCGARHHASCAAQGCALEHAGSHDLEAPGAVASVASASLGVWERVRVRDERVAPERRLLWKLDATSNALEPERGEVPGACFELPRAGVGDALARAFDLSEAVAVAMAIAGLLTVLLTPPGGGLRLIRCFALAGALALAVASIGMAHAIATKRLSRESTVLASAEVRRDFGVTHGIANVAGTGEALLVLVGLVLALTRRHGPTP
jgi:hypothetical protein